MKSLCVLFLALASAVAGEMKLGQPLTLNAPVPVARLLASPAQYVGKTVQVKGQVADVCRKAGCWMEIVDPSSRKGLRVKVNDGEIVFPSEALGKTVVAEGKLAKMDLTREQIVEREKHFAEENGRKFDPSTVKSGATIYQIQGVGAVVFD